MLRPLDAQDINGNIESAARQIPSLNRPTSFGLNVAQNFIQAMTTARTDVENMPLTRMIDD